MSIFDSKLQLSNVFIEVHNFTFMQEENYAGFNIIKFIVGMAIRKSAIRPIFPKYLDPETDSTIWNLN